MQLEAKEGAGVCSETTVTNGGKNSSFEGNPREPSSDHFPDVFPQNQAVLVHVFANWGILEEDVSVKELPLSDWFVSKSVGHFFEL